METDVSFEDDACVRLLLVPVGGISPAQFDAYCSIFENATSIPLAGITRPPNWSATRSPFKSFTWFGGSLKVRWTRAPAPDPGWTGDFGAINSAANKPSLWQDFQAHRRIFGVVGVLHHPTWKRLMVDEARARARSNPDSPSARSNTSRAWSVTDVEGQLRRAVCALSTNGGANALHRVCVFGRPFDDADDDARSSPGGASGGARVSPSGRVSPGGGENSRRVAVEAEAQLGVNGGGGPGGSSAAAALQSPSSASYGLLVGLPRMPGPEQVVVFPPDDGEVGAGLRMIDVHAQVS